jgi:hypothetical protein
MKIIYELKQDSLENDYIEMTTSDGVISFVPINEENADYQAYLESLKEASAKK